MASKPAAGPPLPYTAGQVHEVTTVPQMMAAVASGRAVAVDYTSPTCGPCVAIAPVYAQLAAACPAVLCLSVRTDVAPAVASQYNVRVTPTFQFFYAGKPHGAELKGANRTELQNRIFELGPHIHIQRHTQTRTLTGLRHVGVGPPLMDTGAWGADGGRPARQAGGGRYGGARHAGPRARPAGGAAASHHGARRV
jgi:thiol-disulfide isomerase/thioredoxin